MGQIREVDALSDAIIETEREIAGEAWGQEDTERLDASGDRALESMGDGLEGQHEADEDEDAEGAEEDAEGEESEDGEDGEGEGEDGEGETDAAAAQAEAGKKLAEVEEPRGRVPSGKLREEAEKRRAAEARIAELEAKLAAAPAESPKIAALEAQLAQLTTLLNGQRPAAKTEEPPKQADVPDIFENPQGFVEHITNQVQQAIGTVRGDLRKQAVETSFAIAHGTHKDAFAKAYEAINGLNPNNPEDRVTVQRIYNSANPGEELVKWHRRTTALARVGEDPDAYEARVREETRQALLKDPEFRKQLIADMRGEAVAGENGGPRTTTRLPKSLARSGGSNLGVDRGSPGQYDDSEQSVADAAWR